MRIYLWAALRNMDLRKRVLNWVPDKNIPESTLRSEELRCATAGKLWRINPPYGVADKLAGAGRNKRQGRRTNLSVFGREVIHPYKYMRIYLWTTLRIKFFRR
jgi:hypothetical protein